MPFLRVLNARIDPSKIPDLLEIDNAIAAALGGMPGLRYRAGTIPDADGHGIVVTVWDTREQADTVLTTQLPGIAERIAPLNVVIESSQIAEVANEYVNTWTAA